MHEDAFRQALRQRLDGVRFPEESRLQVLTQIKGEPKVKKKLSLGLILAFALILITLTVLAATQTGLLQYLVGSPEKASQELVGSVQPLDVEATADNIHVKLTGTAYDGEKLVISWETENLNPDQRAMLSVKSVTAGEKTVWPNYTNLSETWLPYIFGLQEEGFDRHHLKGGMVGLVKGDEKLTGQVPVKVEIAVQRPAGPLVVVDDTLFDKENDDEESRAYHLKTRALIESFGIMIAKKEEQDPEAWFKKGYIPVDAGGNLLVPEGTVTGLFDNAYPGRMEVSAVIPLNFTLDADKGLSFVRDLSDGKDIKMDGFTVRVNTLRITPLTTRLNIHLIPEENSREQARVLHDRYTSILPTAGGKNLAYSDMEYEYGTRIVQLPDGQWVAESNTLLPGVSAFPDSVTLSPRWSFPDNMREDGISQEDMKLIEEFEKVLVFKVK